MKKIFMGTVVLTIALITASKAFSMDRKMTAAEEIEYNRRNMINVSQGIERTVSGLMDSQYGANEEPKIFIVKVGRSNSSSIIGTKGYERRAVTHEEFEALQTNEPGVWEMATQ